MYVCVYVYMYISLSLHIYIYIYIYRERESFIEVCSGRFVLVMLEVQTMGVLQETRGIGFRV